MYSVKGFVTVLGLLSNVPSVVSEIGELSDYSYSFSKEKGFYEHDGVLSEETVELTTFTSKNGDAFEKLPTALHANIFTVADYVAKAITGFTLDSTTTSLTEKLYAAHTDKVENLECGEMITATVNGTVYIAPEWVSWSIPGTGDYVRIWFVDSSFRTQYDEYTIVVVPPFTPLDNFFLAGSQVEALLNAVKFTSMVDKMQLAKDEIPETIFKIREYDYHNPSKTTGWVGAKFGVLIYGEAGNNEDAIRTAISNYILANTNHTRDEWAEILPDIFKVTEFVFVPMWNSYAIPNRELEPGIYSPLAIASNVLKYTLKSVPKYSEYHVTQNISSLGHTFQSLAVGCIGGPENRNGMVYLTDWWPDYISVSTSSTDFNRMKPDTQEFAIALDVMIQAAEKMTRYSRLPAGYSRLIRDDILYIERTFNNVQYLVVAKVNFDVFDAQHEQ